MKLKAPAAKGRGMETLGGNIHALATLNNQRTQHFDHHRAAALALLNSSAKLTRKAGSFLGQIAVDASPLSSAQSDWLAKLLDRNGLPSLAEGGRP